MEWGKVGMCCDKFRKLGEGVGMLLWGFESEGEEEKKKGMKGL